jgi:hypothetical protein
MLRELKVVEQRYQAVPQVLGGIPVTEVTERSRYREGGLT